METAGFPAKAAIFFASEDKKEFKNYWMIQKSKNEQFSCKIHEKCNKGSVSSLKYKLENLNSIWINLILFIFNDVFSFVLLLTRFETLDQFASFRRQKLSVVIEEHFFENWKQKAD